MSAKINDGLKGYERWRLKNPEKRRASQRNSDRTPNRRYAYLIKTARRRGLSMTISRLEWDALISQPCFYCGGPLSESGHGLDRINSDIGYVQGNVRQCCGNCNCMKMALTENQFKESILRIFNHWINR